MRRSLQRALLPCAATMVVFSLRCGGDPSTSRDAQAPGNGSSSGGSASSGSSGGSDPEPADSGGGGAMGSDATDSNDAYAGPDVGTPVEAGSPGQVDITFDIHADQGARAISPYVYGVNNGGVAAAHHAPIVRSG